MSSREKIDRFISKWISRKLIVFIVASFGLFGGHLTSSDWITIATAYIAVQGVSDIVEKVMKNKS